MSERSSKRRRSSPLWDLVTRVLEKVERQDARLAAIEMQQTLAVSAIQRQGRLTEEVNRRCMEKLGICPLVEEDEDDGESGSSS
jgi:hypothetical protein